jgi:hypothetical protein
MHIHHMKKENYIDMNKESYHQENKESYKSIKKYMWHVRISCKNVSASKWYYISVMCLRGQGYPIRVYPTRAIPRKSDLA